MKQLNYFMTPETESDLAAFLRDSGFVGTTYPFKENPARIVDWSGEEFRKIRVLFPPGARVQGDIPENLFKTRLFFSWDPCKNEGLNIHQGVLQFERDDKPEIGDSYNLIKTWLKDHTVICKEHPWKGWFCAPDIKDLKAVGHVLVA